MPRVPVFFRLPALASWAIKEGAHLLMEWTKECMAARGWHGQDFPPDQP